MFCDEMRAIPGELRRTKPIQHLQKIPVCLYAVQRSLAEPRRDELELGYQMCEAIGHWLLEALRMADAILKLYLDSQHLPPSGGQTLASSRNLPISCVQSAVVEPAENILNRHTVQGLTDCLVQAVLRPRRDPAKLSLNFDHSSSIGS